LRRDNVSSLETRISKLERSYTEPTLLEQLLAAEVGFTDEEYLALDQGASRDFAWILIEAITPIGRKVVDGLLERFDVPPFNPLALECFRGRAPESLLRDTYLTMQNFAFNPDVADRRQVQRRAGVIDENGGVAAGYVLLSNGCIVPEPTALPQPEPTREGVRP
jgi:hypothetical protein